MIELKQFKLPLAECRSKTFDFERASLNLLAKHKPRRLDKDSFPIADGWYDEAKFQRHGMGQQGAHHHG